MPGLVEQVCAGLVLGTIKRNAEARCRKVSDVIMAEDENFSSRSGEARRSLPISCSGFAGRTPFTWVGVGEIQLSQLTSDGLRKWPTVLVEYERIELTAEPNQPA
ncbi:MAG: hypothetical protein PHE53_03360 [Thermoguttaceae bacterium]|nr:hypothetical protein [Thermoguttaceae bacterium]